MSTATDPIADMLTRIRNAMAVNRQEVLMPYSQGKYSVAKVLADSGFLQSVKEAEADGRKQLVITINSPDANAAITSVKRLSSPGRRLYVRADAIPKVKGGRGIVVISTSSGIMTGEQARAKQTGGELICEVF